MTARSLTIPPELRSLWGENLRAARLSAGVTAEELAELVGVSRVSVSSWENGRTAPSYANRLEVVRALTRARSRSGLARSMSRLFPAA